MKTTKTTEETVAAMLAHIASECTAINREDLFDAMLDDCFSFESIGGPFAYMSPSSVLKECDPTAYRCGVNDWADSQGWVEIDGENYDGDEAEKARDSFIEDLESELSDLETELEETESEIEEETDGSNVVVTEEVDAMTKKLSTIRESIAELEEAIAACQKHAL